jgi:hypothetical protein
MKKHLLLLLGVSLLTFHPALANDSNPTIAPAVQRFDLDFPGGRPKELVKAIERATGKPLNVIIPNDCDDVGIPGISVKNVAVAQLFEAVTLASKDTRRYVTARGFGYGGGESWSQMTLTYGFRTEGTPNENSIWYFYRDKLPEAPSPSPAAVCRFYQLSPYLDAGYKVEDITTAIETAWKMLGIDPQPDIKYHKDTKLLIAVGEANKLQMIDDALGQLFKGSPRQKSTNSQDSEKSKTQ